MTRIRENCFKNSNHSSFRSHSESDPRGFVCGALANSYTGEEEDEDCRCSMRYDLERVHLSITKSSRCVWLGGRTTIGSVWAIDRRGLEILWSLMQLCEWDLETEMWGKERCGNIEVVQFGKLGLQCGGEDWRKSFDNLRNLIGDDYRDWLVGTSIMWDLETKEVVEI